MDWLQPGSCDPQAPEAPTIGVPRAARMLSAGADGGRSRRLRYLPGWIRSGCWRNHSMVNRHQSLRTRFVMVGEETAAANLSDAGVEVR